MELFEVSFFESLSARASLSSFHDLLSENFVKNIDIKFIDFHSIQL